MSVLSFGSLARALALTAFVAMSGLSGSARAMVLTFDDIPTTNGVGTVPQGYGGFVWGNASVLDTTTAPKAADGAVSGANVLFDTYQALPTVTLGSSFTFNGAYFTSRTAASSQLTITGYTSSGVSTITTTINSSGPTWVQANFANVTGLTFNGSRGRFLMDDFTFNEGIGAATAVPELDGKGAIPALALLVFAVFIATGRRRHFA